MHKGSGGIQNLNDALQNCLNNSAKAKRRLDEEKNYQSAKQVYFKEKLKSHSPLKLLTEIFIFVSAIRSFKPSIIMIKMSLMEILAFSNPSVRMNQL